MPTTAPTRAAVKNSMKRQVAPVPVSVNKAGALPQVGRRGPAGMVIICKESMRHSYATHVLEAGVNPRQTQAWLGHCADIADIVTASKTGYHVIARLEGRAVPQSDSSAMPGRTGEGRTILHSCRKG